MNIIVMLLCVFVYYSRVYLIRQLGSAPPPPALHPLAPAPGCLATSPPSLLGLEPTPPPLVSLLVFWVEMGLTSKVKHLMKTIKDASGYLSIKLDLFWLVMSIFVFHRFWCKPCCRESVREQASHWRSRDRTRNQLWNRYLEPQWIQEGLNHEETKTRMWKISKINCAYDFFPGIAWLLSHRKDD